MAKVQLQVEYENKTLEAFVSASRFYTKFDCSVARQNFSSLDTAHDCETGSCDVCLTKEGFVIKAEKKEYPPDLYPCRCPFLNLIGLMSIPIYSCATYYDHDDYSSIAPRVMYLSQRNKKTKRILRLCCS